MDEVPPELRARAAIQFEAFRVRQARASVQDPGWNMTFEVPKVKDRMALLALIKSIKNNAAQSTEILLMADIFDNIEYSEHVPEDISNVCQNIFLQRTVDGLLTAVLKALPL